MKNSLKFGLLFLLLIVAVGCETGREKYVRENKKTLTEDQKKAVMEGKLYVGMPREAVVAAIGRPTRINADFLGHQVTWYYDYDRNFGTRNQGVFKTSFIVELVGDKVYNWRED